ncbi:type I-E CRISPR-associated protein Cse2/CasB [Bifidobacterium sp. ESL0798]|uniref:type I-E CRISPR-associated protein Cse2/CasB n=1 Tax=Bifidobacterium sp. ESL0798 TaxID=2983235 RepID=UPI0023F9E571|nr:type I-E CRISPR-associated protein Cse2/CasB [Bifidobacterium sp. ESL0798]WEV73655.1 type I-E CRISPR-associated protein Cse2/CasB [Bifidobacterium sp. ESL0798]
MAKADALGKFVNAKVSRLQRCYVYGNPREKTWARAQLARLRRMDTQGGNDWMAVGDELFEDWPIEELGVPEPKSRELLAVKAALQLYAYHQQSESSIGMNLAIDGDTPEKQAMQRRSGSFGGACRGIQPDLDHANGVHSRLRSLETSSSFEDSVRIMRELIKLMRSAANPRACRIYYRELAKDLYRLQFDGKRDGVIMRWGRDYYMTRSSANDGDKSSKKQ